MFQLDTELPQLKNIYINNYNILYNISLALKFDLKFFFLYI